MDAILVWRLDRWGRSLPDLVVTLKELAELSIGFISLTETFDMTTPTGRALGGMLAVFEHGIVRERVKASIAQARAKGTTFGRSKSAAKKTAEIRRLYRKEKLSKSELRDGRHRKDLRSPPSGELYGSIQLDVHTPVQRMCGRSG